MCRKLLHTGKSPDRTIVQVWFNLGQWMLQERYGRSNLNLQAVEAVYRNVNVNEMMLQMRVGEALLEPVVACMQLVLFIVEDKKLTLLEKARN
jgi:hypothetical protein